MSLILDGTNGETLPSWTTATRPVSPVVGQMGYNTTTGNFDAYTASGWVTILPSASGSTTQLPSSAMPTGSVLQVVQGTLSTPFSTSSATYVSTGLTASITPKFANSKILVIYIASVTSSPSGSTTGYTTIYRNSTNLEITTGRGFNEMNFISGGYNGTVTVGSFLDSPATISSTTYTIYMKCGQTIFFAVDGSTATITLLEIAG